MVSPLPELTYNRFWMGGLLYYRFVVGPVGFEPTTSGPDFSESPAPQVYRPRLDSGILWAGSIPLTKLDDGP